MQAQPSNSLRHRLRRLQLVFFASSLLTVLLAIFLVSERLLHPAPPERPPASPDTHFVQEGSRPPRPAGDAPDAAPYSTPAIALVLDDMGSSVSSATVRGLLALPVPFTLSLLPEGEARFQVADLAMRAGKELQLHLPMEPEGGTTGSYTSILRTGMSPGAVDSLLNSLVLPDGLSGLNNHMGSAATQSRDLMRSVVRWAGRRGWYILDSVTHPRSLLYEVARQEGVPALRRSYFLDHDPGQAAIQAQLNKAVAAARRSDRVVVVIGHPKPTTLRVLEASIPDLLREGMTFVTLSQAAGLNGFDGP